MARPKVIFATTVFDAAVNGPAVYAQYLWRALRDDEDVEFHVVTPPTIEDHSRLHTVTANGRRVMRAVHDRALQLAAQSESPPILHGNTAYMMHSFVRYAGPWIAQVNDYEAATVWESPWTVARRRGPRRFLSLAWRRRHEAIVAPRAPRLICNSDYLRQIVLRCYPSIDPQRCTTIPKAVEVDDFTRPAELPRDPLAPQPRGARLLFVGANWRLKGLPTLLRALPRVVEQRADCRLTIVGPRPPAQREIAALAARFGVGDAIHFAGRVNRGALPPLLWHSDIYVHPAEVEAFGVSIVEALAAGLPVIASRVGGVPEIIRTPIEGMLISPRDPDELTAAILQTLDDERLRQDALSAGPARAEAFSVARMIGQVKRLYLEMAENR